MFNLFNNGPLQQGAIMPPMHAAQQPFNSIQSALGGLFAQHPGMFSGPQQMQPLMQGQMNPMGFRTYAAGPQQPSPMQMKPRSLLGN